MRLPSAVLATAFAIVLLAPGASAHLGAVEVDGGDEVTTTQSFEHMACIPTCEVQTSENGNAPPVLVVDNGSVVRWTILTGSSHTATSDRPAEDKDNNLQNRATYGDLCLSEHITIVHDGRAKLVIREGVLELLPSSEFHKTPENRTWETCQEAVALPDGRFALSYHCNVHPRFQHGVIVVEPAE